MTDRDNDAVPLSPELADYVRTHRPVAGRIHPDRLDRFGWEDDDTAAVDPPQCGRCRHRLDRFGWSCRAFPAGIPGAILRGDFDHTKPYLGDGGIRFEPEDA